VQEQQEQLAVVFSIRDMAIRWKVDRQAIARAIKRDQLPAFKIGGQWRVLVSAVQAIEQGQQSLQG